MFHDNHLGLIFLLSNKAPLIEKNLGLILSFPFHKLKLSLLSKTGSCIFNPELGTSFTCKVHWRWSWGVFAYRETVQKSGQHPINSPYFRQGM
jgi:hypothetical protein